MDKHTAAKKIVSFALALALAMNAMVGSISALAENGEAPPGPASDSGTASATDFMDGGGLSGADEPDGDSGREPDGELPLGSESDADPAGEEGDPDSGPEPETDGESGESGGDDGDHPDDDTDAGTSDESGGGKPGGASEPPETDDEDTPGGDTDTAEEEENGEKETAAAGSIGGLVWIDVNADGIRDSDESPLADFPVALYTEDDTENAVDHAMTDSDGNYMFERLSLGTSYVIGAVPAQVEEQEYLLPASGVTADNQLAAAEGGDKAFSRPIRLEEDDAAVRDIDIGMRLPVAPMARGLTYTFDLGADLTSNTQVAPGVLYKNDIYTFHSDSAGNSYIITGETTLRSIAVEGDVQGVTITLHSVRILCQAVPVKLQRGAEAKIILEGNNSLKAAGIQSYAGISVPYGAALEISGSGSLEAQGINGGAGIGGDRSVSDTHSGDITISGGNIKATGSFASVSSHGGAGIGGGEIGDCSRIEITGGTVTATGGRGGAGIGGGSSGNVGTINIQGGRITASGGENGAGIGSGRSVGIGNGSSSGTIVITGGEILATGGSDGAGIGGGKSSTAGMIDIHDGRITASGGENGAGIGNGDRGNSGVISITGGEILATGGSNGAGIGGGNRGNGETIEISGGTVTARGNNGGAGIGGGRSYKPWIGALQGGSGGAITLTGGTVTAIGSGDGAGIGGGHGGNGATPLTLDAAADVRASARSAKKAIDPVSITGTGYYFNASLVTDTGVNHILPYDLGLRLFEKESGAEFASMTLPAAYRHFAFTTPGGEPRTVNIRAYDRYNPDTGTEEDGYIRTIGLIGYYTNANPDLRSYHESVSATKVILLRQTFAGFLSHSNVTATAARLSSSGHTFMEGGVAGDDTAFHYTKESNFDGDYTTVLWKTGANPTVSNPHHADIRGLTPNTLYIYRAYLQDGFGEDWSGTQAFLTLPQINNSLWGVTATEQTVTVKGEYGSIAASANSQSITGVKVFFSTDPDFSDGTEFMADQVSYFNTDFRASVSAERLDAGVAYYVRVEVSNQTGGLGGAVFSDVKSFRFGHVITEKYADSDGNPIDADAYPDTSSSVREGGNYTKTAPDIPDYTYVGYRLDDFGGNLINRTEARMENVDRPHTVYFVYQETDTVLCVSVPVQLMFAAFAGDGGGVTSPTYHITNRSLLPVEVSLAEFSADHLDGLALVQTAPAGSGELRLDIAGKTNFNTISGLPDGALTGARGYMGQLGARDSATDTGRFTIGGRYSGGFGTVRGPKFNAVITFDLVVPTMP